MHTRSLRRLLLGWLLIPLLVLLALGSVGTFYMARNAANDAYDKELLDPMLALAQYIQVVNGKPVLNLPPSARDLLLVDAYDNIYYQLIAADGSAWWATCICRYRRKSTTNRFSQQLPFAGAISASPH